MKVLGIYTDWNNKNLPRGCGHYRIIQPMTSLQRKGFPVDIKGQILKTKFTISDRHWIRKETADELYKRIFSEYELLYVQHLDNPHAIAQMFAARDFYKKKVILDIDDDIYHVHQSNPAFFSYKPGSEKIRFTEVAFRSADALTVSTEALKKVYSHLNSNISVLENRYDPMIWDRTPKEKSDSFLRIGYAASNSHYEDLKMIHSAILQILRKYRHVKFCTFGIWCDFFKEYPKDQFEFQMGTKDYTFNDWPKRLSKSGIDIGIAPLLSDTFNRCKSPIKFFEYASIGVPMVASEDWGLPYGRVIEHGKNGYLAKFHKDWINYLSILIERPTLREELGRQAKEDTEIKYNIDDYSEKYWEVFKTICPKFKSSNLLSVS